jgi:hypothetical protein
MVNVLVLEQIAVRSYHLHLRMVEDDILSGLLEFLGHIQVDIVHIADF